MVVQVEQLPVVQVGVDLKLFRTLAEGSSKQWDLSSLAEQTGAEKSLLARLLRYLRAFGLVQELRGCMYQANDTTCWLATPGAGGGVKHYFKTVNRICSALPDFLAKSGYRNPTSSTDCAFNLAFGTDKPAYGWTPEDPDIITAFTAFIKAQRVGQKSWMDAYPVQSLRLSEQDLHCDRVLFVDVGGSAGHQCIAFREQYPDLNGQIVLQDRAPIIARLDQAHCGSLRISATVHDFFTP